MGNNAADEADDFGCGRADFPRSLQVWTDGSLVLDQVTGVSSSGAGFLLICQRIAGVVVGGVMLIVFALRVLFRLVEASVRSLGLCRLFKGLRCGGAILALQSADAVHVEGRGREGGLTIRVWFVMLGVCLMVIMVVKDGDLLLLIDWMLRRRGLDTVRITKVKGHAGPEMVLDGRVRELDKLGDDAADEAADFGRWRVGHAVIDACGNFSGVCGRWYPVILELQRFFIAIPGLLLIMVGMMALYHRALRPIRLLSGARRPELVVPAGAIEALYEHLGVHAAELSGSFFF